MVDDPVMVRQWRTKKRLAQLDCASYFLSLHEQIGGAQARWRCSGSWLSSRDDDTAAGEARRRCTNSPDSWLSFSAVRRVSKPDSWLPTSRLVREGFTDDGFDRKWQDR